MRELLSALIAMVWMLGLVNGCGSKGDMNSSSASVNGKRNTTQQPPADAGECGMLLDGAINTGTLPEGCSKIEGDQIGEKDIQVTVNGIEVTFTSWKSKDGEAGDFIGFDYVSSAPVCVSVKASTLRFVATQAGSWTYPQDTGKPHGISNVVICQPTQPESDPDSTAGADNPGDNASAPAGGSTDGGSTSGAGADEASSGGSTSGGSTSGAGADEASSGGGSTDAGSAGSTPEFVPEM